jgi:hypothetical protein
MPFGLGIAEPEPEETSPDKLYEKQLQRLAEEGYDNIDMNLRLLEMHGGDIDQVIRALSGGGGKAKSQAGVWS